MQKKVYCQILLNSNSWFGITMITSVIIFSFPSAQDTQSARIAIESRKPAAVNCNNWRRGGAKGYRESSMKEKQTMAEEERASERKVIDCHASTSSNCINVQSCAWG